MRSLLTAVILLTMYHLPLSAQRTRSDSLRLIAEMKADSQRNFTGWHRLLMYCQPPDSNAGVLCDSAFAQIRYLASISKLSIDTTREIGSFAYLRWSEREYLPLQLLITSTKGDGPAALYATLRATAPFDHAIEKGESRTPRKGDLILWENDVIGASSAGRDELMPGISGGIETLLKQFVADYVGARQRE
jgi:hypothetical protein